MSPREKEKGTTMKVYVVEIEQYNDDGGLDAVEVVVYASEQTANQHADRVNKTHYEHAHVRPTEVLTKLREF
jgi:ribosomal protein L3